MRVVLCDLGLGNLRSVERALLRAAELTGKGIEVHTTSHPEELARGDKIVLPGQSAFRDCARAVEGGLGDALRERIAAGVPFYGMCMGLQLLFEESDESPGSRGLGVLAGRVKRLAGGLDGLTGTPLKIPHVGWNTVEPSGARGLLPAEPTHFYFVHSYVVVPAVDAVVAGTTEYGERFVSAVSRGNIFASQFHPEKSQGAGLALLGRFLAS
jgi:glutamine amidotransferase